MRQIVKKILLFVFLPIIFSWCVAAIYFNFSSTNIDAAPAQREILKNNSDAGKVLGISEINNGVLRESNPDEVKSNEAKNFSAPDSPLAAAQDNNLADNRGQTDKVKILNFNLAAEIGAVMDSKSGSFVFDKQADQRWPIASITKLVTALVFLDYNPGWEKTYQIKETDRREGGRIYLFTGEKVKIKDLFYFSLVGSDNTATIALVNATGHTEQEFVEKMNQKTDRLGFTNTEFKDVIGLNNDNVSTAKEIAKLSEVAFANEEINKASLTKKYEFTTQAGIKKTIYNTNTLLNSFPHDGVSIIGGKTGHVEAAGYCLVGKFKNEAGKEIITVVLGAPSDQARFNLTKNLVSFIYKNY